MSISALLVLNLGGTFGSSLFFLILAAMALRGPLPAFKALAICYLGLMTNVAFVPKTLVWTPARLALPALCLFRVVMDLASVPGGLRISASYAAFLSFIATMTISSVLSGWYTHIALLKLLNYTVCLSAIFGVMRLLRLRRIDTSEWIVSLTITSAMIGCAAILFGQANNFLIVKYGVDGAGITTDLSFNGAFLHPNCHALFGSLFVLFGICIAVFSSYRRRYFAVLASLAWTVFVVVSQSRTAVAATLLPALVLVAMLSPRIERKGATLKPRLRRSTLLALGVLGLFVLAVVDVTTGNSLSTSLVRYAHKWDQTESATRELDLMRVMASRQALIDFSWANFLESPVYGIGFGVAKTQFFIDSATLFTAPAEKGFLPTAILEEGGILGAVALTVYLLVVLATMFRERNIPAIVVFLGFLTSNFGEVTLFSPGGSGGFGWIMVGAATILGDHCWIRRLPPQASVPDAGGRTDPVRRPIAA